MLSSDEVASIPLKQAESSTQGILLQPSFGLSSELCTFRRPLCGTARRYNTFITSAELYDLLPQLCELRGPDSSTSSPNRLAKATFL
jgi:hypothetical protein